MNQRAEKRILGEDEPTVAAGTLGVAAASGTDLAPADAPAAPSAGPLTVRSTGGAQAPRAARIERETTRCSG